MLLRRRCPRLQEISSEPLRAQLEECDVPTTMAVFWLPFSAMTKDEGRIPQDVQTPWRLGVDDMDGMHDV